MKSSNKETGGFVFSAGLGTRFKPWTDKHPKALAVVNGKSLLQRNIEYLQQYGISQVVVNVHHFAEQIVSAIDQNKGWGSNIVISDEKNEVLETGGGLLKAKDLLPKSTFLTINVDILTDLDLSKLLAFHRREEALITLCISDRKTSRYLLFDGENNLCGWRSVKEGAVQDKIVVSHKPLVQKGYSGIAVFEPTVFDHIPFTGKFSLIDLYLHLAPLHKILGYDHTGDKWIDVGKPDAVAKAEQLFL